MTQVHAIHCTHWWFRAVPFTAVISPGSLSIIQVEVINVTNLHVPQLDFGKDAAKGLTKYRQDSYAHGGGMSDFAATDQLYQIAMLAAVAGRPASFSSQFPNMTYQLQFNAPAVKCTRNMNKSLQTQVDTSYGYSFMSWVPEYEGKFFNASIWNNNAPTTLDTFSREGALLYVASPESSITQCELQDSLYDVVFDFKYPEQHFTVLNLTHQRSVYAGGWNNPEQKDEINDWRSLAYAGIMEAFGRLLVGKYQEPSGGPDGFSAGQTYATSFNIIGIDWTSSEHVQTGLQGLFQNITLSLLSRDDFMWVNKADSLWGQYWHNRIKSETATAAIPVTVSTFSNVYSYNRQDLWLAYGLGLFGGFLCAIIGLHAAWTNIASYQNVFSTFLRVADDPELRNMIESTDDGSDPLPEKLRTVRLRMYGANI